jgi:nicotinate dehydrogenase subunit B
MAMGSSHAGSERGIDRRTLLRGAGALVLSFSIHASRASTAPGAKPTSPKVLDSWLAIDGKGRVSLYCGKVEIGQGIATAFAQIVAEELDVPFEQVTVIQADTAQTPDQGVTSASRSIAFGGVEVRQAAAEARQYLLKLAGQRFAVAPESLAVSDGVVSDGSRRVSYSELIGGRPFDRQISGRAPVKKRSDYKVVGTSVRRIDIPRKVNGQFCFIQDVRLQDMLHARVVRPAAIGAKLKRVVGFGTDRPNVKVVRKNDFLAVVAPSEWEAIEAAADLRVEWSEGIRLPAFADLETELRNMPIADVVIKSSGDLGAGFRAASKIVSSTYVWPFQAHGSIGPSCAVADVRPDGTATVWSATQDVYMQREAVARLLKLPKENVRIIYVEGSGCYGHNGSDDANGDAALLSQELGRPVRVQWMRHDEHGWAPRGAPYLVDLRAGLNDKGAITAWDFQSWATTHSARYRHYGDRVSGYLLASQLSGGEVDVPLIAEPGKMINTGSIAGTVPTYSLPSARVLIHGLPTKEPHPLRPTELRSTSALAATFAIESFVDELAASVGEDPVRFRLAQLTDPRSIDVLKAVRELVNWQARPSPKPRSAADVRTGRGVALLGNAGGTYAAAVAEVAVDRNGRIRVMRLSIAHDCGLIVNPDGLTNQIEGNLLQAMSRSLFEQVQWDQSGVTSLDWISYPILRFPDVPDVQISLINRPDVDPSGAGERATMPIGAAIANAVFDAVGARIRHGPFTPDRLKAAMSPRAR